MGLRAWIKKWKEHFDQNWWLNNHARKDLQCNVCGKVLSGAQTGFSGMQDHDEARCFRRRTVWCINCQPQPGVNVLTLPMGKMVCPLCKKPLWPI
jgi:hypothetical protein